MKTKAEQGVMIKKKMKSAIVLFFIMISCGPVAGNGVEINIDSLENIARQIRNLEKKADKLNEISGQLYYTSAEKSYHFAEEALELSCDIGYYKGQARAEIHIGYLHYWNYEDSIALVHYNKALEISKKHQLDDIFVQANHHTSKLYFMLGKYEQSLEHAFHAMERLKNQNNKAEKAKVSLLIGKNYQDMNEMDKALEYMQASLKWAREAGDPESLSETLNSLGVFYYNIEEYDKAIEHYKEAVGIQEKFADKSKLAITLYRIGNSYRELEEYESAIIYYQNALTYFQKLNHVDGIANCYNNLGIIQDIYENHEKAVEYYQLALSMFQNTGDKMAISDAFNNMAIAINNNIGNTLRTRYGAYWIDSLYYYRPDSLIQQYDTIISYYNRALEIREEYRDKSKIANSLGNIGTIYIYRQRFNDALVSYQRALAINMELGNKTEALKNYFGLAFSYNRLGQYRKALNILLDKLEEVKDLNKNELLYQYYEQIFESYNSLGKIEFALDYYMKFHNTKERFLNEERLRQTQELETKYQTAQKEASIQLLNKEKKVQDEKIKRQNMVIWFFVIGFIIITGFAILLLRLYRRIQKANIELDHKNKLITKQKQEITDSIYYAQRIQKAALPSHEFIDSLLHDYFILFRPRDIVSGDFYWITGKNNKIVLVAADCTGHGVPGAFMSMLGVSFLNEIVNKNEVTQADLILNDLRENVKTTLSQTGKEGESKDGMDIALVIIEPEQNRVQYAGAYNPLYLFRNGDILETKADKMPIGIYAKEKETFTNHIIETQPGDTFYIFSDGFVDQFGGDKGRKYMSKPFKRLLSEIHHKPMPEQKIILDKTIDEWRGGYQQLDDIIIFGVKIGS